MRSPHVARKQNPPKMIQHFRNLGGWLSMILDIQYGPWLNGLDDKNWTKKFCLRGRYPVSLSSGCEIYSRDIDLQTVSCSKRVFIS